MLSVAIFVNAREQAPLRSRLAREASAGTRAGAFAFATATGVHAYRGHERCQNSRHGTAHHERLRRAHVRRPRARRGNVHVRAR